MLRRKCPDLIIPDAVWYRRWILHVTAWGKGEQAVRDYLARYVLVSLSPTLGSSVSMMKPLRSNTKNVSRACPDLLSERP